MIDPSDAEIAAMQKCLKAFGEAAGEIGFTKPLGDYSEKEAMRVINLMPAWTPGEQGGKKVAVWYTLPISFRLQ